MNTIVRVLLLIALAAVLFFGIQHAYESWRASVHDEGFVDGKAFVQQLWDKDREQMQARHIAELDQVRKQDAAAAAAAIQGEKDARDRAEQRAAAAAAAAHNSAAAAGGMRNAIATLDANARARGVPDAASCPGEFARQRDDAIRARAVLAACSAEYRQLAADADGDAAGVRLQLDTALSFIRATGAPGADQIQP